MTHATRVFIIRQRLLMVLDHQEGLSITAIARKYRTSRRTVYRWLRRYRAAGRAGLLDRSHRPHRAHPRTVPAPVAQQIVALRHQTGYGPRRLRYFLARDHQLRVSEHAIYRVLVQQDLITRRRRQRRRPAPRYTWPTPGASVQIDTKYLERLPGPVPGTTVRWFQYTATDDCTRWRVIRLYDELSAQHSVTFLQQVVEALPFRIQRIRTDNGVEFTYGPCKVDHPFTRACQARGITHRLNRPSHPEANGKVERSHRTDDEEFYQRTPARAPQDWLQALPRWESFYNTARPHMGLNMLTPVQRYEQWLNEQEGSLHAPSVS